MANCIVCNAYTDNNDWCSRCETSNRGWHKWQQHEPVEQEGIQGLLAFIKPHVYLPLIVTILATLFGFLAIFTLWLDIKPGFRAIAWMLTPVGCLLSLQGIYEARMQIRKSELLRQVKRGWKRGISAQVVTLLLPAVAVGFVLLLTIALIQIEPLWELVKWLALVHAAETGDSLPEKFLAVLPLVSMIGYIFLTISFTAASSLMLARVYINQLNKLLPHPIFLQDQKLTMVIRKEAEIELGRLDPNELRAGNSNLGIPPNPTIGNVSIMGYMQQFAQQADPNQLQLPANINMLASGKNQLPTQIQLWSQAANWIWDELARTDEGGITMKVARDEIYKLPKQSDSGRIANPRVSYVVCAGPWGRITKIERDVAKR
jgi:hypothetical protein